VETPERFSNYASRGMIYVSILKVLVPTALFRDVHAMLQTSTTGHFPMLYGLVLNHADWCAAATGSVYRRSLLEFESNSDNLVGEFG
jgi:hypothetical protein